MSDQLVLVSTPASAALADVRARMEQAESMVRSGRINDGLKLVLQCWAEIEQDGPVAIQADCQRIIGLAYQYSGALKDSLLACYRARDLYETTHNPAGIARALSIAAVSLARIGDAGEALALLMKAHSLAQTLDDPGTEFRIWINMSVVYETLEDYPKAIAAAETAVSQAERLGNAHMAAHARTKLYV